jgi:SAM-dependent methyltransferase
MAGARPQRLVFGEIAEEYDRYRPDYPDDLFELLLDDGGVDAVLDVGSGTGRAARAFADRGLPGIAVEPSAEMGAVARANLPDTWAVERSDFEHCEAGGRTDWPLITCAQAWHWVDHDAGLRRAADLLAPSAVLAVFWNRGEFRQDALRRDLDEIYDRLAPDMQSSLRGRGATPKGQLDGIEDAAPPGGFASVDRSELRWERTYTAEQWVSLLGTHSDHRMLEPAHRAEVHDAVHAAIEAHGGSFVLPYRVELLRFRRS